MRAPFKKSIGNVPREEAHGGSGSRQLLLSPNDPVSSQFQAMTKGFLPAGGVFDWHQHENIDEYFLSLAGTGYIEFRDGSRFEYAADDLVYIPADTEHRIENTGTDENVFYFIRLNA